MIIDKLVVLTVAIICVAYLSYAFIKKSKKLNILLVALAVFCLGVYVAAYINNIKLSNLVEGVIVFFMILIPAIFVYLQADGFRANEKFAKLNGNTNYKLKKYDEAIKNYLNVKKMDEKTMFKFAMSYFKESEFEKAEETFRKYIDMLEDKAESYEAIYFIGRCYENLNEVDRAIETYKDALKIKPDYYEALESLSLIYSNGNNYEEAIKIYDEILKYYPDMYEANFNKAIIYMSYRNFDEAIICYQKALDENEKLVSARYNIAQIAFLKGDYQKAIDNFIITKEDETYKVRSEYYLAKAYSILKNLDLAKTYLKSVMDKDESYVAQAREEVIFYDLKDYIEDYVNNKLNDVDESEKEKKTKKRKNKTGFMNKLYREQK